MLHAAGLILVLAGIATTLGLLLALADKKLAVPYDPLIDEVEEELPKGQCGNCGFAGCRQYAEAVVSRLDVAPNLCGPGGAEVAAIVAKLTGKDAGEVVKKVAVVFCQGALDDTARRTHLYDGLDDCAAAAMLYAGEKACEYGCLGLGNCARVCPENAITMNAQRLPEIHPERCIGCGICVNACPRGVIGLMPETSKAVVRCRNHELGKNTRTQCDRGCIGCRLCIRTCPHEAISLQDNLAVVDSAICKTCELPVCLVARCRPKAIQPYYGIEVPDIEPPKPRPIKRKKDEATDENAATEKESTADA